MAKCCFLVGNIFNETSLSLPDGCFISVNSQINTELSNQDCDMVGGMSTGSMNISGYVSSGEVFTGCPGRAGVTIIWAKKYDCSADKVHFFYAAAGRSFYSGGAADYVDLERIFSSKTSILTASSQSGPTGLFSNYEQTEGIGMSYSGGPIIFDTSSAEGVTLANMGLGSGSYYLQNFNIEVVPGSIPVANYTFAYVP